MFGFLIGTACLIGLAAVLRGGFRRGYGGRGGAFWLRGLLQRLDASPAQEKVIREALGELRRSAAELRGEARATRADLAKAVRSPSFDETVMGELFARHDSHLEKVRKDTVGAIARVHAVLDDRQRERLVEVIEHGPFGGERGERGGRGGRFDPAWA